MSETSLFHLYVVFIIIIIVVVVIGFVITVVVIVFNATWFGSFFELFRSAPRLT